MMNIKRWGLVLLAAVLSLQGGLGAPVPSFAQGGDDDPPILLVEPDNLVDMLNIGGLDAHNTGDHIEAPYFSAVGHRLNVNGEEVLVFIFDDKATVQAELTQFNEDGYEHQTLGTLEWPTNPQFYWRDHVVVLYVGANNAIRCVLAAIFGRDWIGTFAWRDVISDDGLTESLTVAGAVDVAVTDSVAVRPFMDVEGRVVELNGEQIEIFNFTNAASASAAVAQLGPDGTATVEWDGIPHLYQRETLAVVYIGTNPATLCAMAQLFGKVQAGVPFYPANPISSADDLVNALIAADITAEVTTETVSQDFLSVEGQIVMIEGTAVQVYDYAANPFAFAEFEQISPTGTSVGTISISWMNKPHFYRGDYLLVIYVGTDADVLRVLDDVFGAQFAGG